MVRMMRVPGPFFGLVVVLVACGGGSSATSGSVPSEGSVGEISMTWSGGITGDVTSVVVHPDGQVETTVDSEPTKTTQLAATDLMTLQRLVASPEFADLAITYVPSEGVCCDRFTYTVVAMVNGVSLESATADGLDTPPILTEVIQVLLAAANGE